MSQGQKILAFMKQNGSITQRDAFKFGCYRLGARIYDLKRSGNRIQTNLVDVQNQDGTFSRIAVYKLVEVEK